MVFGGGTIEERKKDSPWYSVRCDLNVVEPLGGSRRHALGSVRANGIGKQLADFTDRRTKQRFKKGFTGL